MGVNKELESIGSSNLYSQLTNENLTSNVAVMKFLCTWMLSSPHNGNLPGSVELLAQSDPFLIDAYDICEGFTGLKGSEVWKHLINYIKLVKCFSVILSYSPDVSHTYQLSLIIRYYLQGNIFERDSFVSFQFTSTYLKVILNTTECNGKPKNNCKVLIRIKMVMQKICIKNFNNSL
ncbi:hypothetical protein PR048_012825 [Dryococelus australis]|uniref:Uncharacterized protein n=1 Tax=Dryococelus australis TaxID=614101 RepID=A0ABQ9HRW8_9NEOP|nr:hypothetical protein PR048_012825 [Dryococelus australis]